MIAKEICYVCGVRPVVASERCSKCQPVNKAQRPEVILPAKKSTLGKSTLSKVKHDDFRYDIQVGD
jgi:hypothetical protein